MNGWTADSGVAIVFSPKRPRFAEAQLDLATQAGTPGRRPGQQRRVRVHQPPLRAPHLAHHQKQPVDHPQQVPHSPPLLHSPHSPHAHAHAHAHTHTHTHTRTQRLVNAHGPPITQTASNWSSRAVLAWPGWSSRVRYITVRTEMMTMMVTTIATFNNAGGAVQVATS